MKGKAKHLAPLGWAVAGIVVGMAPAALAGTGVERAVFNQHIGQPLKQTPRLADPDREVSLFIRLSTPAVSEFVVRDAAERGQRPQRSAQIAHARKIDAEQARLRRALDKLGVREQSALRVGVNGLRVRAPASLVDELRALPGVQSVAPVTRHTVNLTASVPWIGAPAVWESVGSGEGVSIAIIDTGIDYLHANLGGSGSVEDYENNNKNFIEPGTFPTAKVAGGFDFAGPTYDASDEDNPANQIPQPDLDPLDGNGHGSHVGGIAAGLGVEGSIGPGVAPGATLYALKVFGDIGGSTDLTSDAIEWALDPDGDGSMDDHLDVINMSLGSGFGSPDDPSAIASDNAVENGIVVIASAGNSGAVPYITGAPGVGRKVVSVASSISGGRIGLALQTITDAPGIDELHFAVEGAGPIAIADNPRTSTLVATVSESDDGNGNPIPGTSDNLACHPLTNASAMRGRIALVRRGACNFSVKYNNVQFAGGIAIAVYNDGADPGRVDPITMGGLESTGIPGLMISSTDGFAIFDALNAGFVMTAAMGPDIVVEAPSESDDTLSTFTSRGPGHGGSAFKPNVSAPGDGITSTAAGTGTEGVAFSGTSMAAPHVAGAAALLKVKWPDLPAEWLGALLVNSTVTSEVDGPGTDTPYPLSMQGSGVIRVDRAAALTSAVRPHGVAFGRLNPMFNKTVSRKAGVRNLTQKARTYAVTHVPNQTVEGVTVICPSEIEVGAGAVVQFDLSIELDPARMPADDGAFSQREVDGWCVLNDGIDELRLGYLGAVDPASHVGVIGQAGRIVVGNNGQSLGYAEGFTLAGLDGDTLDGVTNAIAAFGFRNGDPDAFLGFNVVEFGLATEKRWESMSNLQVDIYVDRDEDGTEDILLQIIDGSEFGFPVGTMLTAQIPLDENGEPLPDEGFADWFVSIADYNDAVAAVPFTNDADAGAAFLEPGDTTFNYRLVVTGRDETTDTQTGSIDLAAQVVPESASIALGSGETAVINASGNGQMLWLFQNNTPNRQMKVVGVGE